MNLLIEYSVQCGVNSAAIRLKFITKGILSFFLEVLQKLQDFYLLTQESFKCSFQLLQSVENFTCIFIN